MKTPTHPWSFRQRLGTRAFGWRGSKLAIEGLKEALGEAKTVARDDPGTAAETATTALGWMAAGHGYELRAGDV